MCIKPVYKYTQCSHAFKGPVIPCRKVAALQANTNLEGHRVQPDLKRIPGFCSKNCDVLLDKNSLAIPISNGFGQQAPSQQSLSAIQAFIPGTQAEQAAAELLGSSGIEGWGDLASKRTAETVPGFQVKNHVWRSSQNNVRQHVCRQVALEEPPQLSLDQPAQYGPITKHEAVSRAWIEAQNSLAVADKENPKFIGDELRKEWETPTEKQQQERKEAGAAMLQLAADDGAKDGANKKRLHSTDNLAGSGPRRQYPGSQNIAFAYRPDIHYPANQSAQDYQMLTMGDLNGPTWAPSNIDPALTTNSNTSGATGFQPQSAQFNQGMNVQVRFPTVGWGLRDDQILPNNIGNNLTTRPITDSIAGKTFGTSSSSDDIFSSNSLEFSPPPNRGPVMNQAQANNPMLNHWLRRMQANHVAGQGSSMSQGVAGVNVGGNFTSPSIPTTMSPLHRRPPGQPDAGQAAMSKAPTGTRVRSWKPTSSPMAGPTTMTLQQRQYSGATSRNQYLESTGNSNATLMPADTVISGFNQQQQQRPYAYNEITETSSVPSMPKDKAKEDQTNNEEQSAQQGSTAAAKTTENEKNTANGTNENKEMETGEKTNDNTGDKEADKSKAPEQREKKPVTRSQSSSQAGSRVSSSSSASKGKESEEAGSATKEKDQEKSNSKAVDDEEPLAKRVRSLRSKSKVDYAE